MRLHSVRRARRGLTGLFLGILALFAIQSGSQAQDGPPPSYGNINIVNHTYGETGSTWELDTDGDMLGDTTVSDPGNQFYNLMWNEYWYQGYFTNLWVDDDNRITGVAQSYIGD